MKYIVDTDDFEPLFKVDSIGVFGIGKSLSDSDEDHSWSRIKSVGEFEELNSDYINEHYGELQDEAYQKGINDGSLDVKQRVEGAYQAGLNDVWEAVKKIFGYEIDGALSIDEIGEAFGYKKEDVFCTADIIRANTPEQAIAKLKAYEDERKDRIEVGDEVTHKSDSITWTAVVTQNVDGILTLMGETGAIAEGYDEKCFVKTGRHFDIATILEAMKHD